MARSGISKPGKAFGGNPVCRIGGRDRETLRELARQVAEIAADPVQAENAAAWARHNDLERVRPMVLAFPEGAWRELLPQSACVCQDETARKIEYDLRSRIYSWTCLRDDNVIDNAFRVSVVTRSSGWGLEAKRLPSDMQLGAWHADPVILEDSDADKLRIPEIEVDWDETDSRMAFYSDLFGDLLRVEQCGRCRGGIAPLDRYADLRGIDNLFMDLVDNPQLVHRVVGTLVDGEIAIMKSLEAQGALSLGNRNHYVGSGGTGYTRQLPQSDFDGSRVRLRDQWGFATAQIFSEVSPEMHEEFALCHEKRYLELFGLNCYGCCEPLHRKLDILFRHVPRLRRISISPWADVAIAAEKLADQYVFSWKPNPAVLAGETWNPEAVRRDLREFCEKTRGNIVEIVMKDTHTVRNRPERFHDWVRIARETAMDFS